MSTQEDIHRAFLWVRQVYDEARALFDDAARLFDEEGLEAWYQSPSTAYTSVLRANDLPSVYLACQFFTPEEETESDPASEAGVAAFMAVDFFSEGRSGPAIFGGVVRYSNHKKVDHWLINATARRPGWDGRFAADPSSSDAFVAAFKPTARGKAQHAGIEEVRLFEAPLTKIESPERLSEFVRAVRALRDGDSAPAVDFAKSCRTDPV